MPEKVIPQKKQDYKVRVVKLFEDHKSFLIVNVTNVGSNQMQKIRMALRGKATLLMGKNSVIRKCLRELLEVNPKLNAVLPYLTGTIGLVFSNISLMDVRKIIQEYKVPAAARVGALAPMDCRIPPGPTGLDPGQTAFFQALNIGTKIVKGAIEIISEVHLIKVGEKVTPSMVSLLSKLNVKPFFYGMKVETVFEDGSIYDAAVLDLTHDDLLKSFMKGVDIMACLSLSIGYPNLTTIPHSFARAFNNMLALAASTEITFERAKQIKEYLANPEAFAAAAAAAAPAASSSAASAPAAKKEEPKKEEDDDDVGLGGGLFGDD